jgi:predicted small metal-binding protein
VLLDRPIAPTAWLRGDARKGRRSEAEGPLTRTGERVFSSERRRSDVKEFRCGVLVPGCWATFQGESDEEILRQVFVHARQEHGMDEVPREVVEEIRAGISVREPR